MNERQRLLQVMEAEGMNAKQFSQEVGISQGTLSNIMGGRNKPSLDVLQAVLNRFRALQTDWLILGIGPMYRQNGDGPQTTLFDIRPEMKEQEITEKNEIATGVPAKCANNAKSIAETLCPEPAKQVKKIVVFYTDGTYEER